ncbi:vWA domain-containing protein [Solibacillus silvestris]|uniref:vWA domain-containing protein n=1 Tax=Solibacillus silvestris TaxID=76853 RepID=UPI003F7FC746
MTNEYKTFFTDEILHFLYRNTSFQALKETEQQQFLGQFKQHRLFKEMIEISIALEEVIVEVEATMPKIQHKDFLFPQERQKQLLKNRTVVSDNVLHIPFEELENLFSPMVVIVQQSDSMHEFEAFCKGTIFPLFNLCAVQKRDLIIIPFSDKAEKPFLFKNGTLHVAMFDKFLQNHLKGEAQLVPALKMGFEIFEQDKISNQRDLMIITDNQFTDFHELIEQEFTERICDLSLDVSVIAMSEADFQVQPIPFADKVFFANE